MGLQIDEQLQRCLMCHSDKTANELYLRESRTQEAAQQKQIPEKNCWIHPRNNLGKRKSLPHKTLSHLKPTLPPPQQLAPLKRRLSVAQQQQVDKIFAEDIRSGVEPRKKHVVALMKSDLVLQGLVNSQPHMKRVIDRVRYLFDTRSTVDPFDLPKEPVEKRTVNFVADIPEKPPFTIESEEWSGHQKRLNLSKRH